MHYVSDIGNAMPSTGRRGDEMRQPAEWMRPVDDRILELIREYGNLTPKVIEQKGGPVANHAGDRARELVRYGLLERIGYGLYGITERGHAYLDEELDARTLDPVEPADLDE